MDRQILAWLTTYILAVGGGTILTLLGLPASWLTGAMIAVAIAGLAGLKTSLPEPARIVAFLLLGSSLGTSVTPEIIGRFGDWPGSVAAVVITVVVTATSSEFLLRRVFRWDRETAFFSSIPGVTNYVLALALPTRADITRVALSQTLRLFLLVAITPTLLASLGTAATVVPPPPASLADVALTLVAGIAGGFLLRTVGVPAAPMLGAMAGSAALHGTGIASGTFPMPLQIFAFVTLGGYIGTRFSGVTPRLLATVGIASVATFVVPVLACGLCAWATSVILRQPFAQVALGFAPGGIDVMTALAFALHFDSAFVAVHQLTRFIAIAVLAPLRARAMARREK